MNRLIMPSDLEFHAADWADIIKFWHVLFPGARSTSTTAKARKAVK